MDETLKAPADAPAETPEKVEKTEEILENSENSVNISEEGDPEKETPEKPDVVSDAIKLNEELKKQLKDIKENSSNVFEQNEILKKELEDAKKLQELAIKPTLLLSMQQ